MASLDQPDIPEVSAAVDASEQNLRDVLVGMRLVADPGLADRLRVALVAPQWPLDVLLSEIPTARSGAQLRLLRENSPWRTAESAKPWRLWCAPAGARNVVMPGAHAEGDLEATASDRRRAVRVWLQRVHDANQVLEPIRDSPDPDAAHDKPTRRPGSGNRRLGA